MTSGPLSSVETLMLLLWGSSWQASTTSITAPILRQQLCFDWSVRVEESLAVERVDVRSVSVA